MKPVFHPATSCDGKFQFRTKSAASNSARRSRERGLGAYHCSFCGGWHVGHPIKKPGRPKAPPPAIEMEI